MTVLNKHLVSGRLTMGNMANQARSLVPLGARVIMGLTARPYFASRQAVSVQLCGLRA